MTRRPEISCPKYLPVDGRRCVHYGDGPCLRPDEFMCVEWLRANGYLRDPLPDAREHLRLLRATSPPLASRPRPAPVQLGQFPRLRLTRSR